MLEIYPVFEDVGLNEVILPLFPGTSTTVHIPKLDCLSMPVSPEIPAKTRGMAFRHHRVIFPHNPYAVIDPLRDSDLLNRISPSTFHPQPQSLLFAFPTELLRLKVFTLLLSQYEDTSHAYALEEDPQLSQYYRPGCTAPAKIDTAFLYTCRRYFYEARYLPMLSAIHRFWKGIYPPRNDVGLSKNEMFGRVQFCALTRHNLADVTEIQFYTQPSDSIISLACHTSTCGSFGVGRMRYQV